MKIAFTTDVHMKNRERYSQIPNMTSLDSGDWYGSKTIPEELERYSAVTIGNHDSPLGYQKLKEVKNIVACNYTIDNTGFFAFSPFALIDDNGDKDLIIGVGLGSISNKGGKKIKKMQKKELYNVMNNIIKMNSYVPFKKCIVLLHGAEAEAKKIVDNVKGIDCIACGHSHKVVDTEYKGTRIIQSGRFFEGYGVYDTETKVFEYIKLDKGVRK